MDVTIVLADGSLIEDVTYEIQPSGVLTVYGHSNMAHFAPGCWQEIHHK